MATNQGVVGSIPASRTIFYLMNKAFTRETSSEDEDDESPTPALPTGTKNYMTPQGYDRMRSELLQLIDDERPKVVEIVHWAASNGDRSENGDYIYGKKRLREIDRRIRFRTSRHHMLLWEITKHLFVLLRINVKGCRNIYLLLKGASVNRRKWATTNGSAWIIINL